MMVNAGVHHRTRSWTIFFHVSSASHCSSWAFFPAAYLPKILHVILFSISYKPVCISKCVSPVNLLFQPSELHFFIFYFALQHFLYSILYTRFRSYQLFFFLLALYTYSIFIRVFRPEPRNLYPLLMHNIISRGGKILSFHYVQLYTTPAPYSDSQSPGILLI
jgi:hypothetical protein